MTDAALSTRLLLGVLQSATQAVVEGAPRARVKREVLALVHGGLVRRA